MGPARISYSSSGLVSRDEDLLATHPQLRQAGFDESPRDALFAFVLDGLAQQQVADNDDDRRVDQPSPDQFQIGWSAES